ncbi:MAG: GTPase ObgE, partial [Phycisphaerae bacterium]
TPGVDTLLDFAGKHHWRAGHGQPGRGKKQYGRNGRHVTLRLPRGTLIYDRDTGVLLTDLAAYGRRVTLARGGKGGRGNTAFISPVNQTPREAEPGMPGEQRWLRLELKLIADVGIVGLPNAGKSTLLSRLSKARPKIADYPFTTLEPQLGIVELSDQRRFVLADLPGLIQGAHAGAGLGDAFLKHIERTQTILHVVDCGGGDTKTSPATAYHAIRTELTKYSESLADKPELVVGTKIDLTDGRQAAKQLASAIGRDVMPVSAVTGHGLNAMTEALWPIVAKAKVEAPNATALPTPPHKRTT